MADLTAAFHDAGVLAWVLLAVAALGAVASVAGLLAVALRVRAAIALGVVAAALGALSAGLGGAGVVRARRVTDVELYGEGQRPVERQRMRRDGYLLARAPARLGLVGAALPLLAGVSILLVAARRKAAAEALDADLPLVSRAPLRLPAGAMVFGLLSAGFAVAALGDPVPGRNLRADETTRRLLDQIEDVRHTTDPDVLVAACRGLEEAITEKQATFDPGRLPALPEVARRCIEERVQRAAVLSSIGAVRSGLESVARSPFAQHDPALGALVEADLAEVVRIAREVTAAPPDRLLSDVLFSPADADEPVR